MLAPPPLLSPLRVRFHLRSVYNSRMEAPEAPELYAMYAEEIESENLECPTWEDLPDRAKIAWQKLGRRLERERRGQQMLSAYPD